MTTYMIGFDLNREGKNYSERHKALTERLEKLFSTYWHHLDSTWIVVSDLSAKEIRDDLKKALDDNDELLVAGLNGEGAWTGFNEKGSAWLKKHL